MPLNRLALAWQINDYTDTGLIGLHLALNVIKQGGMRPLLYTMPRMISPPPGALEPLRPYVEEMTLLLGEIENSQKSVTLKEALTLHDLHVDLAWRETSARITGSKNVGVSFFRELPTPRLAINRAPLLDRILVLSRWHEANLRNYGIENIEYWRPGYDDWLFYPREKKGTYSERFTIYSAGFMHMANGQDIVLKAFKIFQDKHPNAVLITSWHTPYVEDIARMAASPYGLTTPKLEEGNDLKVIEWATDNGIQEDNVIDTRVIGAQAHPTHISEADVALFPNRCTGQLNMLVQEAMAMDIPCILSKNTGHLDFIEDGNCLVLESQTPIQSDQMPVANWTESSIDEIVAHLEWAYDHRDKAKAIGVKGGESVAPYTWTNQTQDLLDKLADLIEDEA